MLTNFFWTDIISSKRSVFLDGNSQFPAITIFFDFWRLLKYFNFFLFSPQRLPFNHQTPIGYIVALFAQTASLVVVLMCATVMIGFLIGSYWSFILFIDDIANEMSCLKLDKTLNGNMVQLYTDVKQLGSKYFFLDSSNLSCNHLAKKKLSKALFLWKSKKSWIIIKPPAKLWANLVAAKCCHTCNVITVIFYSDSSKNSTAVMRRWYLVL